MTNDQTIKNMEQRDSVVLHNQGQKIFGVFHKPSGVEKFPTVLVCHGLGGQKVGRYRIYVLLAQRLAELGIGTFRFDFRGSGDSEGNFSDMTIEGEVSDALLCLSYLREHPNVIPEQIGIFGRSLGAAVAVLTASRTRQVNSLCLWAPLYDSLQWQDKWQKIHSPSLDVSDKKALMTVDGQIPGLGFYKQFFELAIDRALKNLEDIPLMLIHGGKDQVVPLEHSEKYLKSRLHASAMTEFIQFPNCDHDFSHIDEREKALEKSCKWFKQLLTGRTPPSL